MKDYNKRFALKPDMETSLFAPPPSPKEIKFYLSTQYEKQIDNGSSFSFMNKKWQLADGESKTVKLFLKPKIDLYIARDGKVLAFCDGKSYDIKPQDTSPEEEAKGKKAGRPKWKPGPKHPWRRSLTKKQE